MLSSSITIYNKVVKTMDEKQAMKFLETETKRWAHVIANCDNVKVKFEKSLGRYAGLCWGGKYPTIQYCRTTLLGNLDNQKGLTNLAIHECTHLIDYLRHGHGPDFFKVYEKWTGVAGTSGCDIKFERYIKPKPKTRGAGKTFIGKWKVEYIRYNHVDGAIKCETVKEDPMSKTEATKIFKMACGKDYPAWLYQYVSSAAANGWKKVNYHESICVGGE